MKFNNPKSKDYVETAKVIAGLVLGAMVSRAVISVIHKPTGDASKDEKMLLAKRSVIVLGSGYASSGITGTDTMAVLVKSGLQGMAGMQTIDGVKDLASKSTKLADTSTTAKKAIASAVGLGCACDTPALYGARRRKNGRSLRIPAMQNVGNAFTSNPLDVTYNNALLSA